MGSIKLLIYTLVFRFALSNLVEAEKWVWVLSISILYGALNFATAWITGRREGIENFRFDAGFSAATEPISGVHIALLIWGGFLVLHFILFMYLRRRTIRGVHKRDIFE